MLQETRITCNCPEHPKPLLSHQVLPHWHHEHDVEHTHKAVADSDTHSHHHDVQENESPNKGFLDLFLEMHVNITVSSEILLTHTSSVKQLIVKTFKNAPVLVNHYTVFINLFVILIKA